MELLHGEATCSSVLGRPMLRLRVTCREVADAAPARPADPLCVLLALDRSGSMNGSPLEAAKRAACAFAQHVLGAAVELGLVRLELLCFDHEVQFGDLYGRPASWVQRTIDSVWSRGGTCFSTVLCAIQERVQTASAASHLVVFLTDGQAVNATDALATFQGAIGATRLAVHTLGFGEDHDAAFLAALTLAGSSQGSFQYLQNVDAIENGMHRVIQELEEYAGASATSRLAATLLLGPACPPPLRGGQGCHEAGGWQASPAASQPAISLSVTLREERGAGREEAEAEADGALPAVPAELAGSAPRRFSGHIVLGSPDDLAAAEQGAVLEVQLPWGDDGGPQRLVLALRCEEEPALREAASLALDLVRSSLIQWTAQLANRQLARQEIEELRDGQLATMRRELAAMQPLATELLAREGREAYRTTKTALLEAAALLNAFEAGVLAEALSDTLSNHSVASFNHQAYALLGAGALRKGLAKRVGQNLDLVEETEAAVAAKVRQLEAAGHLAALPALDDVGCCAISCLDYREALQAGDCLCLGLDIERPQAAVMDPSRLVVRAIAPTRISADSFMAALRFSLGGRDPQQVHGGFGSGYASQEEDDGDGRPAPCVVTGEGREAITGALPLWLCKEHWAVAALLARPLLGWMTTLSPLGYSEEQLRVLPFLVLSRALQDLEAAPAPGGGNAGAGTGKGAAASPFRLWVAGQVLATCRAVYRMRRQRILAGLLEEAQGGGGAEAMEVEGERKEPEAEAAAAAAACTAPPAGPDEDKMGEDDVAAPAGGCQQRRLAFLAGGPAARTVDVVSSVEVLLGHLLCAVLQGDVALPPEDWEQLRLAVTEEELRRCQPRIATYPGQTEPGTAALLGLDADAACEAVLARWTVAHPGSEDAVPDITELQAVAAELAAEVDWGRQLEALGTVPAAQSAEQGYQRRVRPLLCLLARIEALATAHSSGDSSLDVSTPGWRPPARLADWLGPLSLAALLLQNSQGARNSERRAYLEAGRYVDPFIAPEALLRRHWQEEVMATVRSSLEDLRSASYLRAATRMAERFATAATLEAAADAIQGWQLGRPFIARLLLATLHRPGTTEPVGKMRLLMEGALGDRNLRGDGHRSAGAGASAGGDAAGAPAAVAWAPCRAAVYAFLKVHHRELALEEALQLFQGCRGVDGPYLAMQYAAGFDPVSPLTHRRPRRGMRQRGEGGGGGGAAGRKRDGQAHAGGRPHVRGRRA